MLGVGAGLMATKRSYSYERPEHRGTGGDGEYLPTYDAETILWMKNEARREGVSYGEWCKKNGILSEWQEKMVISHEVPQSRVGVVTMAEREERMSLETYEGAFPGGEQVASVLLIPRYNKVKLPKRPRGRPRKHFKMVRDE